MVTTEITTMKNLHIIHTHSQWVQTLTSGCQTDGLFRLSPALAMRLLPIELMELRRDLVHCRKRQQELAHEAAHLTREGRETHEQGIIRRRLDRQRQNEVRLRSDIALMTRAVRSLSEHGRFLPPPRAVAAPERTQPLDERAWSRACA